MTRPPPPATRDTADDGPELEQLHHGQRVRVHVNLHKQRLSVLNPRTGKVITYVDDITLTDVAFRHQPRCVDKVRERGVRAVCAYAIGLVEAVNTHPPETGRRVRYNPFARPDFHDPVTGETVDRADRVVFTNLRAYAVSPSVTDSGTGAATETGTETPPTHDTRRGNRDADTARRVHPSRTVTGTSALAGGRRPG